MSRWTLVLPFLLSALDAQAYKFKEKIDIFYYPKDLKTEERDPAKLMKLGSSENIWLDGRTLHFTDDNQKTQNVDLGSPNFKTNPQGDNDVAKHEILFKLAQLGIVESVVYQQGAENISFGMRKYALQGVTLKNGVFVPAGELDAAFLNERYLSRDFVHKALNKNIEAQAALQKKFPNEEHVSFEMFAAMWEMAPALARAKISGSPAKDASSPLKH